MENAQPITVKNYIISHVHSPEQRNRKLLALATSPRICRVNSSIAQDRLARKNQMVKAKKTFETLKITQADILEKLQDEQAQTQYLLNLN